MTALILMVTPKMRALGRAFLRTFDKFAEARMRRAQREIARHSRWMRADLERSIKAAQAGR